MEFIQTIQESLEKSLVLLSELEIPLHKHFPDILLLRNFRADFTALNSRLFKTALGHRCTSVYCLILDQETNGCNKGSLVQKCIEEAWELVEDFQTIHMKACWWHQRFESFIQLVLHAYRYPVVRMSLRSQREV